ncbi:glycosyltransferase [Salinisphaera hydrothermalis]|nr:glycosyltransferase [Salinisphaera hydrothermalis]
MSRVLPMPSAASAPVVVCVPVRDEARRLPALVAALAAQMDAGEFELCLVFDGDEPALRERVVRKARAAGLALVCRHIARGRAPNAGRARRAAAALGLEMLGDRSDALLLTTDADSIPAPDWIAASRAALAEVDVVAGYVRRDNRPPLPIRDRLEAYLERLYALERELDPIAYEPAPSHPGVGGASLGFRADVYRALGGFGEHPFEEDLAIVDAARRAGYRLRRDRAVRVTTSSRLFGRARSGLADDLRGQRAARELPRVEHPADASARYRRSAAARALFLAGASEAELIELAAHLDYPLADLRRVAATAPSADAFALALVPPPIAPRDVDLATAEIELTRLLDQHEPTMSHA